MSLQAHDQPTRATPAGILEPRVAFIDRDEVYRTALAACLRAEGFEVAEFCTSRAALDAIGNGETMDALLIDSGCDGADRGVLFDELRRVKADIPVAIIARAVDDTTEEAALHHGAADFLVKSRGPTIVARRLHLLINGVRSIRDAWHADDEDVTQVGQLTLRLESHRALWCGDQVPLTVTEFRIVRLLACGLGKPFTYREIYDVVHGAGFMAGDGLDGFRINVRALIKKIRKRFRGIDQDFDEIENVPGHGYRWRQIGAAGEAAMLSGRHAGSSSAADRLVA